MWVRIIQLICSLSAGQAGGGELFNGSFLNLGMTIVPLVLMLTIHACDDQEYDSGMKANAPMGRDSISYRHYTLKDSTGQCGGGEEKCARVYLHLLRLQEDDPAALRISRYMDTALQTVTGIEAPNPRALADAFLKEMAATALEEDFASGAWLEVQMKVMANVDTLFTVGAATSIYEGGAHGMEMRNYFHFDPQTGRLLTLDDLFSPQKKKMLLREAETRFRQQFDISPSANINEKGFWFENDTFSLPSEFYLTPDTIHFIYNPYEVAPYAVGMIEIVVRR